MGDEGEALKDETVVKHSLSNSMRGFLSLFLGQMGGTLIGFASITFLTRHLGQLLYGQFSYIHSFVAIFGPMNNFGLVDVAIRKGAQEPKELAKILGNLLSCSLIMGLATYLIVYIGAGWWIPDPEIIFLIRLLAVAQILEAMRNINAGFYSLGRFAAIPAIQVSTGLLTLLLILLVGKLELGLTYFITITLLTSAFSLLLTGSFLAKQLRITFVWNRAVIAELLHQGLPIGASKLLITLHSRLDILFIQYFVGFEAVALYSVALMVVEKICMVVNLFNRSMFPLLATSWNEDRERFSRYLAGCALGYILLSALVIPPFLLASKYLFPILFGEGFSESASVSSILILLILPRFINSLCHQVFIVSGRVKSMLTWEMAALVLSFMLNLLFVPQWHAHGAAMATWLTMSTLAVARVIYIHQVLGEKVLSWYTLSPSHIGLALKHLRIRILALTI
jgi:O-antigen/teichoic acid export membrane protein